MSALLKSTATKNGHKSNKYPLREYQLNKSILCQVIEYYISIPCLTTTKCVCDSGFDSGMMEKITVQNIIMTVDKN